MSGVCRRFSSNRVLKHSAMSIPYYLFWRCRLAVLALLAVCLAACGGGEQPPAATATPADGTASLPLIVGTVQQVVGDQLELATAGGLIRLRVAPEAQIDLLLKAEPADVTVGDWLVVGGVPNPILTFAITGVVIIPPDLLAAAPFNPNSSVAGLQTRVAIPFFGQQGVMEGNAITGGRIASVGEGEEDRGLLRLEGWGEAVEVRLTGDSAIRRATAGSLADIPTGSRVAALSSAQASRSEAALTSDRLLVLPEPPEFPVRLPSQPGDAGAPIQATQ